MDDNGPNLADYGAVIVAVLALALSGFIAWRQHRLTRTNNYLPIVTGLLNEFRSSSFREDIEFVERDLRALYEEPIAISDLPDEHKSAALNVAYYYQMMGVLLIFKVVDEKTLLALLGRQFRNAWSGLEPFVLAEREKPRPLALFAFLQELSVRAERRMPEKTAKKFFRKHGFDSELHTLSGAYGPNLQDGARHSPGA